jgi:hypothetical protein
MTTDTDGANKTRVKTRVAVFNGAPLVPGNPGNTGGKTGRSGRTPDAFKLMCRDLVSRDETLAAVDDILRDKNHPAFLGALNWATNHGYGKAKESLEVSGPEGEPIRQVWLFGAHEIRF